MSKTVTEVERDQVKVELGQYRKMIFPRYRDGVNNYLQKFNTG